MIKNLNIKKQLLTLFAITTVSIAYGQVGINNTSPKATLDVVAKKTDGSTAEGVIAPRLTGDQIQAANLQYGSNQAGTIVYATSAVTTPDAVTGNITASGYYYFDGSVWKSMGGSGSSSSYTGSTSISLNGNSFERAALTGDVTSAANTNSTTISNNAVTTAKIDNNAVTIAKLPPGASPTTFLRGDGTWQLPSSTSNNLYTSDGTLTSNRTVTQGSNSLAFNSNIANGFSVNGSTFSVDGFSNRVGIGTSFPTRPLEVNAKSNPLRVTSLPRINTSNGDLLTIDNLGDVRVTSISNLLAGATPLTFVNTTSYNSTGNETVIWVASGTLTTVQIPTPSANLIGKSITIIASGFGGVNITGGGGVTVSNGSQLNNIPEGKRITIFAISAGVFGNTTPTWVCIAKDF